MEKFRQIVALKLAPHLDLPVHTVRAMMESPPNSNWGDVAIPCFALAKQRRQSPASIAAKLASEVDLSALASKVEAMGGYLNITFLSHRVAEEIMAGLQNEGFLYGNTLLGQGKNIVIDFSSPNIAKPFGIGHLRTTVIGHSLSRIFTELGYSVVRVNHLGDWGTQFGKLIVAYELYGEGDPLEENAVDKLFRLYVKFHQEAAQNPALESQAREYFRRLEAGDPAIRKYWELFKTVSLVEFKRVYELLDITFDHLLGESFYEPLLAPTVAQIEAQGLATLSDGALIVDLEAQGLPPMLLKKSDGATLYATRDLAAALYRQRTHEPHLLLYVVGQEQTLVFKQLAAVLKLMGEAAGDKVVHVSFGLFKFPEGRMSTRRGNIVFLEDVLNKSIELALAVIEHKNPALEGKEEIAEKVGVGAIIFSDLKHGRIKDVTFDWEEMLNFDGETGPYLQYTHARACAVLRKAAEVPGVEADIAALTDEYALPLIKLLGEFAPIVAKAALEFEPSVVARYVLDLAQAFNRFYHHCRIIGSDDGVQNARLALVRATKVVLARGLYLLGLSAVERM